MSAPDTSDRTTQSFGTIVVVGGGCYGSYYVRQLGRAFRAGAVEWERLIVVDRDPACAVAGDAALRASAPGLELALAEWGEWFGGYLGGAAATPDEHRRDAIVPSPLMPHLMYQWLLGRARHRASGRSVVTEPLDGPPDTPWSSAAPDGTQYVSFATWTCPINCIEPQRCPVTRGPRDWSMPVALRRHGNRSPAQAIPTFVFHCAHRAYGVGMIDVADVLAADRDVAEAIDRGGPYEAYVATASHCHGAVNRLVVR